MAKQTNTRQKYIFNSKHDGLTLHRDPVQEVQNIQGRNTFVTKDQLPIKFVNGQYVTFDKAEAKWLLEHRLYGVRFEIAPVAIVKDAEEQAKEASKEGKLIPEDVLDILGEDEPEEEIIEDAPAEEQAVVEEVTEDLGVIEIPEVNSFNEAQTYLKREFDLEHKQVNSKDKVAKQAQANGVSFPNYEA